MSRSTSTKKRSVVSGVDDHPLQVKIDSIITRIDELKETIYPKDVNVKKIYTGPKAPQKADFVTLRSKIRELKKDVSTSIKTKNKREQKDKKEVKPGAGFLRMVKVKEDLAQFLGLQKKGLGNVYCDALLTSYFTDYFYTTGCKDGSYIVPNKELIKLFRAQLKELGVIDDHDELVTQKDVKKNGTKVTYKGFKFIHLQRILKDHIVINSSGKRDTVPPEGNDKIIAILDKEKKVLDQIRDTRKQLDDMKAKYSKRMQMKDRAKELGDQKAFDQEIRHLEDDKKNKERELHKLCKDSGFPISI